MVKSPRKNYEQQEPKCPLKNNSNPERQVQTSSKQSRIKHGLYPCQGTPKNEVMNLIYNLDKPSRRATYTSLGFRMVIKK